MLRVPIHAPADEPIGWHCEWVVEKYHDIDLSLPRWHDEWERGLIKPNDFSGGEKNLLMTVGATDLLTGLVTSNGLGSSTGFYGSANTSVIVGDSSTAASAGQTDVQAALGSAIQTSGFTSVTNATPIVITNGSGNWSVTPAVGSVVNVAGITTETAANGTFEVSASSSTTVTLLNSAGNGVAGSLASGVMKAQNRYCQIVNGAPSVSTNTVQFVSVYGSTNANFAWQEFMIALGANATNKQTAPPGHALNRAVASSGTKASGSSWTFTCTITLS